MFLFKFTLYFDESFSYTGLFNTKSKHLLFEEFSEFHDELQITKLFTNEESEQSYFHVLL